GPAEAPPPTPVLPGVLVEQPPPLPRMPESPPFAETFAPTERGFGGFGGTMSPVVGHLVPLASYRFAWFPSEPVQGQPTNLGYTQHDISLVVPVWQDPANELSVNAHVRAEFFNTDAILPNTLQPFPGDLWNIHFGTSYRHLFDNGWIAGGSVSVGSASDKPFHGIEEMTAGVNAFLRIPRGEHDAWILTLSYSPTNELAFPVPGVAYLWQPSPDFRAFIGLPFSLWWRPIEDLTLDLSYMLVRTVHARATYRVCPAARVYAAFDWSNESYFLADRPNENDRFFYYDKRLSAGVLFYLGRSATLDFSGGYVFDRFYFEGAKYSDNGFNRVDVGNGAFVAVRIGVRY
ncbi:MAG TPA: hypothetical protein VKE94_16940, partial [Gemmataceae bacterium]|nr:hypothetical protein [Gemmataceae bacterium]